MTDTHDETGHKPVLWSKCTCHTDALPIFGDGANWYHGVDGSLARVYHLHKEWQSYDCDGQYSGLSNFYPLNGEDRRELWENTLKLEISYSPISARLVIEPYESDLMQATWSELTDEGSSGWELRECYDADCELLGQAHMRDHRAEAAGY